MEQSVGTITEDRTRIQLHSTDATVTIVSLRRELEEARAGALTTRASEEAARLQLSRMMDEQLAQNQTIDSLRRQVESSNTALQQAQCNSQGCHRPTIIPVEQQVSLVTLLSYRHWQPLRQDFVQGIYMALIITTLVRRQIKGTRNICVLCLAGMILIHQDKNHRGKSSSRWDPPHGGPVVTILILT